MEFSHFVRKIYEDDNLLVLDKPSGLVVDSADTTKEETLEDILKKNFQIQLVRSGIVHRLDKDTSGIILVAKTKGTLENLQKQFKDRVVKKEYLALVHGRIQRGGVVDAAIARNPLQREKFTVKLQGDALEARQAVTEYEPLGRLQFTGDRLQEFFSDFNKIQMRKLYTVHYPLFTLVACRPKTGRTHQIRVHLKHIGYPIVSDDKYGGRKTVRLDKKWCPRMFLHATKISFRHPYSNEMVEFTSPLPNDLKKVLEVLEN